MQNLSIWSPALSIWSRTLSLPSFNLSTKPPTCGTHFNIALVAPQFEVPKKVQYDLAIHLVVLLLLLCQKIFLINFNFLPHLQRLSGHPSSRQSRQQQRRGWRQMQPGQGEGGTTLFLCKSFTSHFIFRLRSGLSLSLEAGRG